MSSIGKSTLLGFKISKILCCFNILWPNMHVYLLYPSPPLYYWHESVSCWFLVVQLFRRKSDIRRVETNYELEKVKTLKAKEKKFSKGWQNILMGWCKSEVTSGQSKEKKRSKDTCFLAWKCLAFKFQNKISCGTCLFFGIFLIRHISGS